MGNKVEDWYMCIARGDESGTRRVLVRILYKAKASNWLVEKSKPVGKWFMLLANGNKFTFCNEALITTDLVYVGVRQYEEMFKKLNGCTPAQYNLFYMKNDEPRRRLLREEERAANRPPLSS